MVVWGEGVAAEDWPGVSASALGRFVGQAQRAAGLAGAVDVRLTSDAEMRRLNRGFRGKNKPTDVLSFPADASFGGGEAEVAGDLALSLHTAARQAKEQGHTLAEELKILLLHGILHLSGYDHEQDNGEMAEEEQRLRAMLKLAPGLIARTRAAGADRPRAGRAAKKARA